MRHATVDELNGLLLRRRDLVETHSGSRAITAAITAGRLHRVRRGWYMDAATWLELWPESRHLAHVIAVARDARGTRPVFSHESAAVLWGLPLYNLVPSFVHILLGDIDRHHAGDVRRHEGALPDGEVVERFGILCTSLERTVYDVTRTVSADAALACVDAALSLVAGPPRHYDEQRAEVWRAELGTRLAGARVRGIRQARRTLEHADGRSESPLESVGRRRCIQLGFERPWLQVPVRAQNGGFYRLDIGLESVRSFIEVDGKGKYLDEAKRSGRSLEEVLLAEKQREDWVRGTTQWRVARMEEPHIRTVERFAARLASFGIVPPGVKAR